MIRALLLAALLAGFVHDPARADTLRVAVAGNFVPALERLLAEQAPEPVISISLSTGSTGKLYAQILQGAPFDLFLAADVERPRLLGERGIGIEGTRVTYARGRLVLWAPAAVNGAELNELLRAAPPPRVALANPRLAPYGAATEAWLRSEGLWSTIAPRAIRGESIAQAFHFTASGNADLGFVAHSQLMLGEAQPRGTHQVLPAASHPPIEQQAIVLHDSEAARRFMAWLRSPAVQSRLRELGYDSP